jgi:hypothetical protein
MAREDSRVRVPGSVQARERGCTCPLQLSPAPPWTVDGDCPLHGYGLPPKDRALPDQE